MVIAGIERGLDVDKFAPRLSFFWGIGMNLFMVSPLFALHNGLKLFFMSSRGKEITQFNTFYSSLNITALGVHQ